MDRPEIKVGQRWVTRDGRIVRILSVSADGNFPVVGQYPSKAIELWQADGRVDGEAVSGSDFDFLAPSTVKREVALYRADESVFRVLETSDPSILEPRSRISEPVWIEFTLLPGESADA